MSEEENKGPLTEKQKKAKERRDEVLRGFREAVKTGQGLAEAEESLKSYRNTLHTMNDTVREASEAIYQQSTSFKDLSAAVKLRNNMMSDEIAHLQTSLDLTKDKIATLREDLAQEGLSEEQKQRLIEKLVELTKKQEEQSKSLEKLTDQQKAFNRVGEQTKTVVSALTGVSDRWKKTLLGSIVATGNLKNGLLALFAGYEKAFTAGNMLGSTMMKIQEATTALAITEDKAAVSLMALTNAREDQVDATLATARTNRALGVSTQELTKVKTELFQTTMSFSKMSDEEANQLALTMEVMGRYGVSSSLAAKNTKFLADTVGMSGKEIERYQHRLTSFAADIGKSLKTVNEELARSTSTIVKYGNSGMDVFEKLSATAKALNADVNQLTGAFEDQFNTFEGAFSSVGRLNSILAPYGRQLDAIAIMQADVADRARMMTEALHGTELAHKALNGPLSKYYLQMIASSMGTNDLDMVTKLLRGDLYELGDSVNYATKSYQEFMSDDFLKRAETQQDLMQKLKLAAEQFGAAMLPIIRIVTEALTTFNQIMDEFDSLRTGLGYLIGAFIGLKVATMAVFVVKGLLGGVMAIANLSIWGNVAATEANSKSKLRNALATQMTAQAMASSLPAMIGFGLAAAGVGIGVGFAAEGIGKMAAGFKGLSGEAIAGVTAALLIMAAGVYFLSTASTIGAPGLAVFAGAVLAVGAAVALASAGIGYMFENMAKITPETGQGLAMTVAALASMVPVLFSLSAAGLLASVGFAAMSPFFDKIQKMTGPEGSAGLVAFSTLMTTLAQTNLESVASQLGKIAEIIKDISGSTMTLTATVGASGLDSLLAGAQTEPATITPQPVQAQANARNVNQAAQADRVVVTQNQGQQQAPVGLDNNTLEVMASLAASLKDFKDRPVRLQLTASGQDEFVAEVKDAIENA